MPAAFSCETAVTEVPPPARASDDDVIAFVKTTPGAIGYVSAGAATAGVKAVDIK